MDSTLTRLYGWTLRLLPGDLRAEYGRDMMRLFADRLRDANGEGKAARTAMGAYVDVTWQAALEWTDRGRVAAGLFVREMTTMDGWMNDMKFGMRTLLRSPGFTVAAIITLALGIGATVSIFTVVNGVLLQPLPYPDSNDLFEVVPVSTLRGTRNQTVDHPDVRRFQEEVDGILLAAYSGSNPTLTGLGQPEVISGARVTDGLMEVLGVAPVMGRDLRRDDDIPDGPRVAVVSYRFWTERLGRDAEVLGRSITLGGEPWAIIGVAPEGFGFPSQAEVWLPRRHSPDDCGHGCRILRTIGRLQPGTSLEFAEAGFVRTGEGLAETDPDAHQYETFELTRLIDSEVAEVRIGLWVLLGAVVMVLLIACSNVANLMLVRAGARRGEVALRSTLGASRTRIARQLLTESLLLSVAAGGAGLALAFWGTEILLSMAPEALPRVDEIGIDATVVVFTVLTVFVVTVLFGLLPARELSSVSLADGLGSGQRTSGSRGAGRFRSFLLVGEVALSLFLLLGAGLMLRTLSEARAVDLGYRSDGVQRFRLSAPDSRYDSLGVARFYEELEVALNALPEVQAAGLGFGIPLSSGNISASFSLRDRPEPDAADKSSAPIRLVTPGYLEAAGLTLLQGRWFEYSDRRGDRPVAVVNQAFVDRHFPTGEPMGTELESDVSWGFASDPPRTIVGVVGNVRRLSPMEDPEPAIYIPNAQFAANSQYAVLHLGQGVETAMPAVRDVLA
ncbi:MAG: FtsX-like permease family protein, partial [Gemmatimonadetes bacterium]|nr:FtsX-like permease family protein [Gemmatimonadota bacterium]